MWKHIVIFFVLQLVNVILQTIKSIVTIKGSKFAAAISHAIAYGFYTIIVIYMAGDMELWAKIAVTVVTNFIGVYISVALLDKVRKVQLWKIEATVKSHFSATIHKLLDDNKISHNFIQLSNDEVIFNIYSKTKFESQRVKNILDSYHAKFIVCPETVRL